MVRDEKNKIAIVGGGVQGLSVAYFLAKNKSNQVILLEKNNILGGLLGLLEIKGTPIEGAYHHWFNYDIDIVELVKELGLESKLLYLKSKMGLLYDGRIYPFGTPMDLINFSPISFLDRIRVGLCVIYLKFFKDYRRFEDIKAVDWLKKHMGQRAYEVIWEPLLEGKFGNYKHEITMTWMWSRLSGRAKTRTKGGGREELIYPRGGFKQVIEAAARVIKNSGGLIRMGVNLSGIKENSNGQIALEIDGREEFFDKVVVTTPINVFIKLVENLPADYVGRFGKIKYRAVHVGIMVLNQSLMPQGYYWLNINDRRIPLLAVLEHTNILPRSDYGNKTIIYLGNYPDINDKIMSMSNQEILDLYCQYLPIINQNFKKDWVEQLFVFKDKAGQPVVDMEYKDSIPPFETPIKNLFLLTMAQIYPDDRGTSNAVRRSKEFVVFLNSL